MQLTVTAQTEEDAALTPDEPKVIPPFGTIEWLYYWSDTEGHLPSPINVSITGALEYHCPPIQWYNFEVYPHKVKMTNTGYTLVIGAKWKTERPYLEAGPFLDKHVISQIHFHWGSHMMEGSDHAVDGRRYPGEMQVTFFKSEYMTQEEALKHEDGVVIICYLIKYGVNPDHRLSWIVEGLPRVREAQTSTRVGPRPMSHLLPMFFEDFFMYWGRLDEVNGQSHVVRWLVPRVTLLASYEQIQEFRRLCDPWDEPNRRNYRPLQDRMDRHVFLCSPHWSLYNSLLPIPRVPEPSISVLSKEYWAKPWMLPPLNADMIQPEDTLNSDEGADIGVGN